MLHLALSREYKGTTDCFRFSKHVMQKFLLGSVLSVFEVYFQLYILITIDFESKASPG